MVEAQFRVVGDLIADLDKAVGEPLAQPVLLKHRHGDVDVGLELPQPFGLVAHRTVTDAFEGDTETSFEGLRQGDEVGHVHLHVVGVARIAHHLVAEAGDGTVPGGRPPTLGGAADDDHRPAVVRIPFLHGLERRQHLVVVVAVVQRQHVPAVGRPLVGDLVSLHGFRHHAADQGIVDTGVVEGEHDAQPLADLLRHGLGLELLGVAGGHREFAFDADDLGRGAGAHEVPERGLARGRGDADTGRTAVDVVDQIGGLGMASQRAYAPQLRLREQGIVDQAVVLEQAREHAGTAPEAEAVDGQEGDLGVDMVAGIPGRCVATGHGFAHDHPKRVERRDVVAAGEQ